MNGNLATLFDILQTYHSRLEGLRCITVCLMEEVLVIRADWEGDFNYSYAVPKVVIESIGASNTFETELFNHIERAHMLWEVGEE